MTSELKATQLKLLSFKKKIGPTYNKIKLKKKSSNTYGTHYKI